MRSYAFTRSRNALDGDVLVDSATSRWVEATSPARELVLIRLRTPLGSMLCAPTLGVDWSRVQTLRTDAPATARQAIEAGLAPLVRAGVISDLGVVVEVDPARGRLLYEVSFVDVRLRPRTKQTVTGTA